MKKKKVLAILGSTKKHSSNSAILKKVALLFHELMEVEIYNSIDKLPHFNPDLDNENLPKVIANFRNMISKADGVLICSPEYVFSLPGSLKNAIEWNVSTTLFSKKPVAIIIASASGEKAFEALDLIMTTIEAVIPEKSKLLIRGVKGKIDASGKVIDMDTIENLKILGRSLINSMH